MKGVQCNARGFAAAILGLSLACGGSEGRTLAPTTPAEVVGTIQVLPGDVAAEAGVTVPMSAKVLDTYGKPMTGRTIAWVSSNTSSATIDPVSGVLTTVSAGSGTISATADAKVGTATFLVRAPSLVSVALTTPAFTLAAGERLVVTPVLKDRTGALVTGREVVWTSSSTRVATVDASGVVTGLSAGSATITATSEGITGSVVLTITPPPGTSAPTLSSISPATLSPGTQVTITGANFFSAPSDLVFVGGIQATVTSATNTQIIAVLSASYPCQDEVSAGVALTTPAGTTQKFVPFRTATQRTLAVGESFLASDATSRGCNTLPATGTYVISVFNAATTVGGGIGLELTGAVSASSALYGVRPASIAAPRAIVARPTPATSPVDANRATAAREHGDHLRFNLETFKRLGSPRQYARVPRMAASLLRSGAPTGAAPSALPAVPTTVGDSTTINFTYGSCNIATATKISARVVYYGPKAIVLEDKASPLAGKVDADLVAIAQEWETLSYPPLVKNLGDPLAYDAKTDNNGRIIMMFTPQVNAQGANLLGFVQGCDFYSPVVATASNQAEIFYARAITDTSPTSTSINGRPLWRRQMPATVAHETKHIASFAERFAANANFEEIWLEEATAQIEAELYGRAIHGNTWRGNAGYAGVLDCELRPADPACNGSILAMWNSFGWLETYYQDVETASLVSGNPADGESLYGGSWLLVRWLADTYAGTDEAAFLKSIAKNFQNSGVANLVQRSGRSWPELLSQFTLMLAADDVAGVPSPYVEQSWNLPAVWAGYSSVRTDFAAQPLRIRSAAFGNFSANVVSLRGGSAMLVKLGGTAGGGRQVLDLHLPSGAALPLASTVGIAVLRIQ